MTKREADIIWAPSEELVSSCALTHFMQVLSKKAGCTFSNYHELHSWSVNNPQIFWPEVLRFLEICGEGAVTPAYHTDEGPTPLAREWFPDFSLNFADNLLNGPGDAPAIVSWSENRLVRRFARIDLQRRVGAVAEFLKRMGIVPGDRVFGYLPHIPEAITCMLGAAKVGAAWSSCGTDYQVDGVVTRIEKVRPKVLIVAASYVWRGEVCHLDQTINSIVSRVSGVQAIIVVDYLGTGDVRIKSNPTCAVAAYNELPETNLPWKTGPLFPFNHPLYILFSSGTTGTPKGIVHGAGGTLLEHKKEHILHSDVRAGDRFFYQTSTSWMMWNWLVSGLSSLATLVLYDGDPFCEDGEILWRLANDERVTHFGTAAAYLGELFKRNLAPGKKFALSELRAIFSTGSALAPQIFDYVQQSIKPLWLQSISGGTDIVGCFGIGCPVLPVRRGEVQCKSLGYDVAVFNAAGERITDQQGELVCAAPAPSMPVKFLDDPDGKSYKAAYFVDFPGVWRHGDFVIETSFGSLIFGGRSDATLKPGGVRVATADVYAALQGVSEILQALAVGYSPADKSASAESVVLFVVLVPGRELTATLEAKIKQTLKQVNVFFVPKLIIQAPDLPRTPNNKLAELTVKRILHRQDPGNASALINPECLEFFKGQGVIKLLEQIS